MTDRSRSGFTWVELVVSLVIIVVGLALLVTYLNHNGLHSARQVTCLNKQHQLSIALLNYESHHGHFPGYVGRVGEESVEDHLAASWVVHLFPYLDRYDLWQTWKAGDPRTVYLKLMVCSSDPLNRATSGSPLLSYVANCGLPGDADTPACGVFHNHDVDGEPVRVSIDYILKHDGAATTLLLSENIQAGRWTDTAEADVGMVWHRTPGPGNRINEGIDAGDRPQQIKYARPSSHHGGGANVSFCDGHQYFLREDIDYEVYQHLMTPDSDGAGLSRVLEEGDF